MAQSPAPLATNQFNETPDQDDVLASFELVLNESFPRGTPLALVVAKARARLAKLQVPASEEDEFDENALELGVLEGLLAMLPEAEQGVPAGAAVH